jgi:hypothetical protein
VVSFFSPEQNFGETSRGGPIFPEGMSKRDPAKRYKHLLAASYLDSVAVKIWRGIADATLGATGRFTSRPN